MTNINIFGYLNISMYVSNFLKCETTLHLMKFTYTRCIMWTWGTAFKHCHFGTMSGVVALKPHQRGSNQESWYKILQIHHFKMFSPYLKPTSAFKIKFRLCKVRNDGGVKNMHISSLTQSHVIKYRLQEVKEKNISTQLKNHKHQQVFIGKYHTNLLSAASIPERCLESFSWFHWTLLWPSPPEKVYTYIYISLKYNILHYDCGAIISIRM